MNQPLTLPFYIKFTCILLSLICIGVITYIGSNIITPVMLAFLFTVLLLPLHRLLHLKLRFPIYLASFITVTFFVLCIVAILTFLSYQITDIANDFDIIKKNAISFFNNLQSYIHEQFQISVGEQKKYIEKVTNDSVQNGSGTLGTAIGSLSDVFFNCMLVVVFTFLFLLYKTHFILFLAKLFNKEDHEKLRKIITQIKISINNYILGLIFEMLVVSILTGLGLWMTGVKYFILLGLMTGILNLIPYIGIMIAGILTILSSLSGTPEISIFVSIIVVNIIVQLLDNNILVPLIINSKVKINALFSIIGIIVGGAVGGISGMFLAIPLLAILKIIFDRIDYLEPWGYVIGNHMPEKFTWRIRKIKSEK
ncbi:AI-2E family transporter [Flavobacterium cheongpyeongense]|uniref:AI-2E family transporter n=1 Tax=Flavobacterium cheongpyeongense TaxID=2212651 RepID=A0A2V4BQS7_9FLAO|nr:AI-2E family transporter [Flavobacterium cheongpyeongense]PXY41261.1 AI-2E family transporter [Flavobacterium cheongpyeongense]